MTTCHPSISYVSCTITTRCHQHFITSLSFYSMELSKPIVCFYGFTKVSSQSWLRKPNWELSWGFNRGPPQGRAARDHSRHIMNNTSFLVIHTPFLLHIIFFSIPPPLLSLHLFLITSRTRRGGGQAAFFRVEHGRLGNEPLPRKAYSTRIRNLYLR